MSDIANVDQFQTMYLRQARRLRAMYRQSPIKLHRALNELAAAADRTAGVPAFNSKTKKFAAALAASLDGSVLRYSARRKLIQQAAEMGIRRFDANLLIAAIQHRLQQHNLVKNIETIPPRRSQNSYRWLAPVCVLVLLQTVICGSAFLLIHGI